MPGLCSMVNQHILVGNDVYTITKGVKEELLDRHHATPQQYLNPTWAFPSPGLYWILNDHPYLLHIPHFQPFTPPLFDALNFAEGRFPLEGSFRSWTLAFWLQRRWLTLERNLRVLPTSMLKMARFSLPQRFHLWAYPERFGYRRTFFSRHVAQEGGPF